MMNGKKLIKHLGGVNDMELTKKEQKFLKRYDKMCRIYVFLLAFIFIFAAIQLYLYIGKFIPIYLRVFQKYSGIQHFIYMGLMKCVSASFLWIGISVSIIVGNLYSYRIMRRILKKLTK